MTACAGIGIEASGGGGVAATSLRGLQSLREAGELGASGEAGGFGSFQARLHSMLAALEPGAGADEARETEAADDAELQAEGTSAANLPAAGGSRTAALSGGTSAGPALPGQHGLTRVENWMSSGATSEPPGKANPNAVNTGKADRNGASLDATSLDATSLDATSLDATSIGKPSQRKPDSAGIARAASHAGRANAGRRPASETSGGLSGASLAGNVVPAVLAVVSPIPVRVAAQSAGSSLKSVAASGDELSLASAIVPRSGSAFPAARVEEKPGAGQEGAGAKLAVSVQSRTQTGAVDFAPGGAPADAPEPGETAISSSGSSPSAEHELTVPSSSAGQSHPAVPADFLAPAALADSTRAENNSVDPAPASSQLPAGREFTQAAALPGSRTSSGSAPQLASVRGRTSNESAPSAGHINSVELSSPADASLLARHPGGDFGELRGPGGASNSGSPAATGSRETFAALDAEPAAGTPSWIHAGARQAEAGFQDPALGWVGVRADLSGGGVHAAIVPGSAEAAQSLSGHLAGINAHLAAEQIPVDSLRMAQASGSESLDMDHGAMRGGQQGTGQQGDHSSEQGLTSPSGMSSQLGQSAARGSLAEQSEPRTSGPVSRGLFANGTHISVVA